MKNMAALALALATTTVSAPAQAQRQTSSEQVADQVQMYERLAQQNIGLYEERTGRSRNDDKGGDRGAEYFWHTARTARSLGMTLQEQHKKCSDLPSAQQDRCFSTLADNAQKILPAHFTWLDAAAVSTQALEDSVAKNAKEYFTSRWTIPLPARLQR